jgi:hypothetical protein
VSDEKTVRTEVHVLFSGDDEIDYTLYYTNVPVWPTEEVTGPILVREQIARVMHDVKRMTGIED